MSKDKPDHVECDRCGNKIDLPKISESGVKPLLFCPACNEEWLEDCDDFGCHGCGYINERAI